MFKNIATIFALTCLFSLSAFAPVQAASSESYQQWLEKYGAWDRLENEYSQEADKDLPETILKRAEVYLNLNSPEKALEIIEMTPSFDDNATEAERLWVGGRAHRALGDLQRAVLWFSQAAKFMNKTSDMRRHFKNEYDLEYVWKDVWLKSYWSYEANYTLSRDSQKETLNQILNIGQSVWGGAYWAKANQLLNPINSEDKAATPPAPEPVELGPDGQPLPQFITMADKQAIARALAAASLEKFDEAYTYLAPVSQIPVRAFWTSLVIFLETGNTPENLAPFVDGNYLKAQAFWEGNLLAPYATSRAQWLLGNPSSAPWTKFRNNLLSMPTEDANKAINNELGSMLISDQTAALLNSFKLALSLSNGDFAGSATAWNTMDKRALPITLQLAGLALFKDHLNNLLPQKPAEAFKLYPILTALSGAAGQDMVTNQAPFWTTASPSQLKRLAKQDWPTDKLLLLAYWQQQFTKKPTDGLAKRAAFLFDDASFGLDCMLYLADEAVKAKKLQLGAFYLNKMDSDALPGPYMVQWLDIKTRLELDSARIEAALKTYKQMVAIGEPIPVMTRLRIALLYQQRRDFDTAKRELLAMWAARDTMTTTLQAETLFWLGEGEQAMRNPDKALDYYLQLAYQYPQENIWALTAMYRASIIYEKRGKYDTAKRLLHTVIRNADRKEQREAAKARISAIDKKMGKQNSKDGSTLVYPF